MSGALEAALRARRESGGKCLVPYLTGGLGDDWLETMEAVAQAGADAIEIGIPFSDPVMDGPTIQLANDKALDSGATPLSILERVRNADIGVPVNFDAAVGDDTVEILGAATSWTLASVSWVGGAIDFVSVENLVADSFGTDTPVGPDEDRTWSITGLGSGTVQGVKFSGFENLTGTSVATDTFEVT